jgi:8-oxo-dGTP pyrophosphatase MutT (NUDIX family)
MVSNPLTSSFNNAIKIERVASVDLTFGAEPLRLDVAHHTAVDDYWQAACAAKPGYFNGTILVGTSPHLTADSFTAICRPMQFKDFLYWRHVGRPDWGFVDLFGSAIVCARAGEALLGVAASTTMNAGSAYFIGGFLDLRDCTPDGRVDIAASIARELIEETGLTCAGPDVTVTASTDTWVTIDGRMISIGRIYRSPVAAHELASDIIDYSRASRDQEIAEVLVIATTDDLADYRILPFTRALCHRLLVDIAK